LESGNVDDEEDADEDAYEGRGASDAAPASTRFADDDDNEDVESKVVEVTDSKMAGNWMKFDHAVMPRVRMT
jgi:hypothetical protein